MSHSWHCSWLWKTHTSSLCLVSFWLHTHEHAVNSTFLPHVRKSHGTDTHQFNGLITQLTRATTDGKLWFVYIHSWFSLFLIKTWKRIIGARGIIFMSILLKKNWDRKKLCWRFREEKEAAALKYLWDSAKTALKSHFLKPSILFLLILFASTQNRQKPISIRHELIT